MADGFFVDVDALKDAGLGTSNLVAELDARGVDELDCSGDALGHDGLAEALHGFCQRWHVGVDNLVGDGEQLARNLIDAAGRYIETEENVAEEFARVLHSLGDGRA